MRREKINELIPLSEQTDSMENDPTTPNLKVGRLPAEDNPFYRVFCLPQVTPDMARKAYTGCIKLLDPDQGGNERLSNLVSFVRTQSKGNRPHPMSLSRRKPYLPFYIVGS